MKSKKNFILFAILILSISFANAQEQQLDLLVKKIIDSQNNGIDKIQATNQFLQKNNLIHISQIGSYNYSDVKIQSKNSNIGISQNGSNNYLDVYKNANVLNQSVIQSGNNNFISDFSFNSGNSVKMAVNQDGNNLSIYNNGSNSISRDLKITQTGNSGSIYIFNH